MVVFFTVYVNNEVIQMKYLLKSDHVCTQMKLGLVQSPAYNIDTCILRIGVFEWSQLNFTLHREVTLCLLDTFGNKFYTSRWLQDGFMTSSSLRIPFASTSYAKLPLRVSFVSASGIIVCPSCVHRVSIGRLRICFGSTLALRTNCSSLNLDLFIKSISHSTLCVCGSLEDTQHYFFHCPNFTQQRI